MDDFGRILEAASDAIRNALVQSSLEQAVHGLDAEPEHFFKESFARSFRSNGRGTHIEQPFPGTVGFHLKESARERCDFALTMDGAPLSDPQRSLLEELEARSTLFSSCSPVENKAHPEDAVWLEMKVVRRFVVGRASPGPNRAYGAEINRAIRDLHKLDKDRRISRAGLILVLFAESQEVAVRDVRDATILAMKDGLRPKEPRRVTFPIPDRIGNAFLELVIMPLNCG